MISNNMFPISYRPVHFKGFLYDYLADKIMSHSSLKRIEIELRKGKLIPTGKTVNVPQLVYSLSYQNPILVSCNIKNGPNYLQNSLLSLEKLYTRFESAISESDFYELSTYFCEFIAKENQETEFTVDFILNKNPQEKDNSQTGDRFTWDLKSNSFCENSKLNKENIDIIHQGYEYRLSTCQEVGDRVETSKFHHQKDILGIKHVRAKFRQNHTFQFMKFSFTVVWTLDQKSDYSKLLDLSKDNSFEDKSNVNDLVLRLLNNSKAEKTFEIESEIIDVHVLRNYLIQNDRVNFNALLDRFFRNFELLYVVPKIFDKNDYKKYLSENLKEVEIIKPVIGSYVDLLVKKSSSSK